MSNKFEEIALDKDENVEIFKHKKEYLWIYVASREK